MRIGIGASLGSAYMSDVAAEPPHLRVTARVGFLMIVDRLLGGRLS